MVTEPMIYSTEGVLGWLEQTTVSVTIRQSSWAVMALESVHLLGLAILGGASFLVAVAAVRGRIGDMTGSELLRGLKQVAAAGLALMIVSGVAIALSEPFKYYNNVAFGRKMWLFAVALLLSGTLVWVDRLSHSSLSGLRRLVAALAFVSWLGVAISGRLIGFL